MEEESKKKMHERPELSVILPAYNEGHVIEETLERVDNVVRQTGLGYEIVVVDDGSVDDTKRKVANYANNNGHVKVVSYKANTGKGYAVKTGFQCAKGNAVIFIDSDLGVDPRLILRYFEALAHVDIVVGSKWHPQSSVEISLARRLLSRAFNILTRLLTGVRLKDTQTGLKAVRRKALKRIFSRLAVKRYAYDVELLAVADLYNLKVAEMPVDLRIDDSFNPKEVWRMFVDLLGIAYRLRILKWYLHAIE
jgi:glycosyltransferase involved in cell wall biosynthesis